MGYQINVQLGINVPTEELGFLYTVIEAVDRLYEFWLTGTFALIVASHFTAERMTNRLFALLLITYISFASTMMFRYLVTNESMLAALEVVRETGSGPDTTFGQAASWSIPVSFFVGTFGAIFYLINCYRKNQNVLAGD